MAMAKDRGDGVAYLVGKRGVRGYVDDGVVDRYETVSLLNGPIVFTSYIFFFKIVVKTARRVRISYTENR